MRGLSTTLFVIVFYFSNPGFSQVVFEPQQAIGVKDGENVLGIPWIGGLNSSQYSKADLDGDGIEEWILYDRSANIYQVFRIENQTLISANELCVLLPEIPAGWVLFVDYDGDGKKDIFSNGNRGIIVFKNTTSPGNKVTWQKIADPLFTTGFSGKINLIANATDVPAITDIDSDGDVDILVYNFAIGGYIRYNKNLSQEKYGTADSLDFEIKTRSWGEFEECDCNSFAFNGETCTDLTSGRVMHPGGKALLAFDSNGDGDKDLLVGHEQCIELYYYENMGDADSAYMVDFSNDFPDGVYPANFHTFPAGYMEDLDFDGIKDLVVTPSFEENYEFKIDFKHSNWFYKNIGTNAIPDFKYEQNDFIQHQMLDFGEHSMPVFTDVNADGKKDILVAANGFWNGMNFSGYVVELLNDGTAEAPSFSIENKNYLDLGSLSLINPSLNIIDVDGDQAPDLIYTGLEMENFKLVSWIFMNQAPKGQPFIFDLNNKKTLTLPDEATQNDVPAFFDIDNDGAIDLLLGKSSGALEYYRNSGNLNFELANPAFLGIDRDFLRERRNLVSSVGDIDRDGLADLLVSDSRGVGHIYFAFQSQVDNEPQSVEIAYKNSLTAMEELIKFDVKSWISSADIFGFGSESIVVGGVRGGLQLFQNTSKANPGGGNGALEVTIYPNPIWDNSGLHLKTNQDATVELVSLLGQKMGGPFTVKKFTTTILNVDHLGNGMYILRSESKSGANDAQLFMIMR